MYSSSLSSTYVAAVVLLKSVAAVVMYVCSMLLCYDFICYVVCCYVMIFICYVEIRRGGCFVVRN